MSEENSIDQKLEALVEEVITCLDRLGRRVDEIEGALDKATSSISYDVASDQEMRSVESRVDSVEARVQSLEYAQ